MQPAVAAKHRRHQSSLMDSRLVEVHVNISVYFSLSLVRSDMKERAEVICWGWGGGGNGEGKCGVRLIPQPSILSPPQHWMRNPMSGGQSPTQI